MLKIEKTMENGTAAFSLTGRLDTTTAPELEAELKALPEEIGALTLDMTEMDYISSAGLRVLLSAHKAMSRKNGMILTGVAEPVKEIFDVTGFTEILNIR